MQLETLRRLGIKVAAKSCSAAIGEARRSVRLGVSSKSRCEAAAHAVCSYLREVLHMRVMFKVDKANNAFNILRRDVFLSEARDRAQALYIQAAVAGLLVVKQYFLL